MSRIGKKPVAMPSGVSAIVEGQTLTVKGPKGTLSMQLLDDLVKYEIGEGEIRVTPLTDAQRNRAAWGMQRTNVQNLVTGVTDGFSKVLEITGVGYYGGPLTEGIELVHSVIIPPQNYRPCGPRLTLHGAATH